jgi:hypothetical protein
MEDLAQAISSRQVSNMSSKMGAGGLFGAASGPVAASLSYGAQEPLMAAQNAINQLYSQNYMSSYNPMASFTMGNIANQPGNMANIGQLYGSLASQQYGAAAPLLQMLSQLSEQSLIAPDLRQKTNPWASILSSLGNAGAQFGAYSLGGKV